MSREDLGRLWTSLAAFSVLFTVDHWVRLTGGNGITGSVTFDTRKEFIPYYGLLFGSLLMALSCWIGVLYARQSEQGYWYARFPSPFFASAISGDASGKTWIRICILVFVIFPLVGQVYFISRFIEYYSRGEAVVWRHDNCDRKLCERASMFAWKNFPQDFDAYRYGNYNKYKEEFLKKSRSKGNQTLVVAVDIDPSVRGITFVPILFPLIIVVLLSIAVINSIRFLLTGLF